MSVCDPQHPLWYLQDSPAASGEDVLKRYLAIHFPHKISPMIADIIKEPKIASVLQQIIGPNVKCMQVRARVYVVYGFMHSHITHLRQPHRP